MKAVFAPTPWRPLVSATHPRTGRRTPRLAALFVAVATAVLTGLGHPGSAHAAPADCAWQDTRNWTLKTTHFKVWWCLSGDKKRAAAVSKVAEAKWQAMATPGAGLGAPLPDEDNLIDVYIAPAGACDTLAATCPESNKLSESRPGTTMDKPPYATNAFGRQVSSGDIMLLNTLGDRSRAQELRFQFVHEFFHLQTARYNLEVQGNLWFSEASAVWAERHYAKADSAARRFTLFDQYFLPETGLSLTSTSGAHEYASWIWLYFVEQERGAGAVLGAWTAEGTMSAANADEFNAALDKYFSFGSSLRDFSVRNLNQNFGPDFRVYDEAGFPTGTADPAYSTTRTIGVGATTTNVTVAPLAAQYDRYEVSTSARFVEFDFSSVAGQAGASIDVVAHSAKENRWKRIKPNGSLRFCQDTAGEDYDQLRVVVTNHALDSPGITGSYNVTGKSACGTTQWTGTLRATYVDAGPNFEMGQEIHRWTITGPDTNYPPGSGWYNTTWSWEVDGRRSDGCTYSDSGTKAGYHAKISRYSSFDVLWVKLNVGALETATTDVAQGTCPAPDGGTEPSQVRIYEPQEIHDVRYANPLVGSITRDLPAPFGYKTFEYNLTESVA